ncbi:MAG TPA: hypothetical protein VGP88_05695, partial [Thermoplasmata archaeon]|nr:hypothetical protein [Thermoplasmata archaeon]
AEALDAAYILIESGAYKNARRLAAASLGQKSVFMVTAIGDSEVDAIYHGVVKPKLRAHGFAVARADELRHTDLITNAIFGAIAGSRFVVADLTNARPNSYYELGYAHALGKPGMIIAKSGTVRQFDVAGYRWNYWSAVAEFGPSFEAELLGVLVQLEGSRAASVPNPAQGLQGGPPG